MVIKFSKYSLVLSNLKLSATIILWVLSILNFIKIINFSSQTLFLILLCLQIFTDILISKKSAIYHLPFIALLSPIFGKKQILGLNLLLSDYYTLFILMFVVLSQIKNLNKIKFDIKTFIIFFSLIISVCLNFFIGNLITIKPAISIIQISIICISTKLTISNHFEIRRVLLNWFISIVLVSILMIGSFYNGINLNDVDLDMSFNINDYKNTIDELSFRISYFYSNIGFSLGCGVIIALMLLNNSKILFHKIILSLSFLFLIFVLLLSGMKTSIFLLFFIIFALNFKKNIINNIKYLFIITTSFFLFTYLILNDVTRDLFFERFTSGTSLYIRFEVYKNAFNEFLKYPLNWIIGLGPEFLTGAGNKIISTPFYVNSRSGVEEGTVDSTYVTILIEYGLLIFSIILLYIYKLIAKFFIIFRSNQTSYFKDYVGLYSIFFLFITGGLTQIVGLSKVSWLFFESIVMIGILHKIYINRQDYELRN